MEMDWKTMLDYISGSRNELLSVAGRLARDGETQRKQSPGFPGRFTRSRQMGEQQALTRPQPEGSMPKNDLYIVKHGSD